MKVAQRVRQVLLRFRLLVQVSPHLLRKRIHSLHVCLQLLNGCIGLPHVMLGLRLQPLRICRSGRGRHGSHERAGSRQQAAEHRAVPLSFNRFPLWQPNLR